MMKKNVLFFALIIILGKNVSAQMVTSDPMVYAALVQQGATLLAQLDTAKQQIEYYYQQVQQVKESLKMLDLKDYWDTMQRLDKAATLYQTMEEKARTTTFSIGEQRVGLKDITKTPRILEEEIKKLESKEYTKQDEYNAWALFGVSKSMVDTGEQIAMAMKGTSEWLVTKAAQTDEEIEGTALSTSIVGEILQESTTNASPVQLAQYEMLINSYVLKEIEALRITYEKQAALTALALTEERLKGKEVTVSDMDKRGREFGYSTGFIEGGEY